MSSKNVEKKKKRGALSSFFNKIAPKKKSKDGPSENTKEARQNRQSARHLLSSPSMHYKKPKRGSNLFASRGDQLQISNVGGLQKLLGNSLSLGGEAKSITKSNYRDWGEDMILNWLGRIGLSNTPVTRKIEMLEIGSTEELEDTMEAENALFFGDLPPRDKFLFLYHYFLIKSFEKYDPRFNILVSKLTDKVDFTKSPFDSITTIFCDELLDEDELFNRIISTNPALKGDKTDNLSIKVVLMNRFFVPEVSLLDLLDLYDPPETFDGTILESTPSLIGPEYTTGIVIGNIYLEWNPSGWIVPIPIPRTEGFGLTLGRCNVKINELESGKLVKIIRRYNLEAEYDEENVNSQQFIEDILTSVLNCSEETEGEEEGELKVLNQDKNPEGGDKNTQNNNEGEEKKVKVFEYDPVSEKAFLPSLRQTGLVTTGLPFEDKELGEWSVEDVYMFMKYIPFLYGEEKRDGWVYSKFSEIQLNGKRYMSVNDEKLREKFSLFKAPKKKKKKKKGGRKKKNRKRRRSSEEVEGEEEDDDNSDEDSDKEKLDLKLQKEIVVGCMKVVKLLKSFKVRYFPFIKKMVMEKYNNNYPEDAHLQDLIASNVNDVEDFLFIDTVLSKMIRKCGDFEQFRELYMPKNKLTKLSICLFENSIRFDDFVSEYKYKAPTSIERRMLFFHPGILLNDEYYLEWTTNSIILPRRIKNILEAQFLEGSKIFEIYFIHDESSTTTEEDEKDESSSAKPLRKRVSMKRFSNKGPNPVPSDSSNNNDEDDPPPNSIKIKVSEKKQLMKLKNKLSKLIVDWNLYHEYNTIYRNEYSFVHCLLYHVIGLDDNQMIPISLKRFFKKMRRTGETSVELNLSPNFVSFFDLMSKKKDQVLDQQISSFASKNNKIVSFYSHKDLDKFVSVLNRKMTESLVEEEDYDVEEVEDLKIMDLVNMKVECINPSSKKKRKKRKKKKRKKKKKKKKETEVIYDFKSLYVDLKILSSFDVGFWLRYNDEYEDVKRKNYKPMLKIRKCPFGHSQ